jgi:hypothetical protein
MRLDPAEVPRLPLRAALLDHTGHVVATTPEWEHAAPGSRVYHAGHGHLVVAPRGERPRPELDEVLTMLLATLSEARAAMQPQPALRAAVLAIGLGLVAGRPLAAEPGDSAQAMEMTSAVLAVRADHLEVERCPGEPVMPAPAPAVIALALVQLAVNAAEHEFHDAAQRRRVQAVRLRVEPGPSFYVEWRAERPAPTAVQTHRHQEWRKRWGLGYVRLAADALGGSALPPAETGAGWKGACFSLGARRLALPLAVFEGSEVVRASQTWTQEVADRDPVRRAEIAKALFVTLEAARGNPARLQEGRFFSARAIQDQVWAALPPESGADSIRDVLHGLNHERTLWTAPEPHATRAHALTSLLGRAVGDGWNPVAEPAWRERFPPACGALGVAAPELEAMVYPDPRIAAYLLAEVGGSLRAERGGVVFRAGARSAGHPVARLLADRYGDIELTPSGDALFA